jgi:hypothetical protein
MSAVSRLAPANILRGIGCDPSQSLAPEDEIDLSNKGYSSIAAQNIHAISRLPHGLNGTIDMTQKVASVSRVKSPRVLQRTTPTRNAWYGPFSRDILEQIETGHSSANRGLKRTHF